MPGPRAQQDARGIGDISMTGRYWLLDPDAHLTSNVAIGVGKISYPILQGRGNSRLLDTYAVTVLPTSFVISPAGRVCSRHVGAASTVSLEADIKPVLGSSPR